LKIGIVGLGCIGGSVALALKGKKGVSEIIGIDHDAKTLLAAQSCGAVNRSSASDYGILAPCAIVFICVSPQEVPVEAAKAAAACDGIITDTASTKQPIMEAVMGKGISRFIGGHPMAGSERKGFTAAKKDLFDGAVYVICRGDASKKDVDTLKAAILLTGARPIEMAAERHDMAAALASHLPHVQASILCSLAMAGGKESAQLAAGGFRDMTRVASGDPQMWADILISNAAAMDRVLLDAAMMNEKVRGFISSADHRGLAEFLAQARSFREKITERAP
jgi:prephenate dehydrogenase